MLSFIVDDINQVVKFHYLVQFGVALRYRTVSSFRSIGRYKNKIKYKTPQTVVIDGVTRTTFSQYMRG